MSDILMRQAGMTADHYLQLAFDILKKDYEDWTVSDAVELSKVMAQDFHTSMVGLKMQEIRDAINALSTNLNF